MKFWIGYNSCFCVEADSLDEALNIVETNEDYLELEFARWEDENGIENYVEFHH